jgi:Tfp pilus assembly protein PilO
VGGLKARERWLLSIAVTVAVVVFGYLYVVEPLVQRDRETRDLIAARQALLVRQQRLVARQAQLGAELATLEAEVARNRARLLPGDRAPLAASELQKLVKGTAQEAGVDVRSERILPSVERGGFTEVPIEVTLAGPIRALTTLLAALDSAPAILTVSDLKLRVVSVSSPRELSVTLAIAGYIPGPAAGTTGATGPRPAPVDPRRRPGA